MRRLALFCGLVIAILLALLWLSGGFTALERWVLDSQRHMQSALAAAVRAIKTGQPGALAGLLAVCFGYGVVHAAGPGHGKVLIGGYGVGRRVPMGRLASLALAASLAQAAVAVALVYAGVALLGWTRQKVEGTAEQIFAPLGLAAIGAVGLWLMWRGGCGLWRAVGVHRPSRNTPPNGHTGHDHADHQNAEALTDHHPDEGHENLGHSRQAHSAASNAQRAFHSDDLAPPRLTAPQRPVTGHSHEHSVHDPSGHLPSGHDHPDPQTTDDRTTPHIHDAHCGHAHGPSLAEIEALSGWRDTAALIAGIALRPCSGALFLLILTWQLGIAAAGIAGTFAMGLGTACITIGVAALAVWSREGAFATLSSPTLSRVLPLVELLAGAVVALIALSLLSQTL